VHDWTRPHRLSPLSGNLSAMHTRISTPTLRRSRVCPIGSSTGPPRAVKQVFLSNTASDFLDGLMYRGWYKRHADVRQRAGALGVLPGGVGCAIFLLLISLVIVFTS